MVSWGGLGGLAPPGISVTRALPPGGGLGGFAPQESPLITRALPPQRPCLALGGRSPPYLCLAPRGGSGGLRPPGNSVTRALPPIFFRPNFFVRIFSSEFFRWNFFVGIFSSEFFSSEFFSSDFFVRRRSVRPSVRPSVVRPSEKVYLLCSIAKMIVFIGG